MISIRVLWCCSVLVLIGCLTTTSPGLSWGALLKMFGSSSYTSFSVVFEISGNMCLHITKVVSLILLCRSVLLTVLQLKRWSPYGSIVAPHLHLFIGFGFMGV